MKTTTVEITKVVIIGNTERVITDSMHSKMYGWSKWGGSNSGLVQKDKTFEWSCQGCGERLGSTCPSYMFEFCKNEFIRICTSCQSLKLDKHIKTLDELIENTRHHRECWE
jgi:hypothetical protein